jgi:hypothetical protein
VLPHERTHAGPKEGRLRLLRATRTQVEPLFFLYEGSLSGPAASRRSTSSSTASAAVSGACRATRRPSWPTRPLLIADGHHRYETALAFHEEDGTEASAWILAVIVPTEQDGLTIFPTHRIATTTSALPAARPGAERGRIGRGGLHTGRVGLHPRWGRRARRGARRAIHRRGAIHARRGRGAGSGRRRRGRGAFLLRPPTVEQVSAVARAGKVMPQKSTFFYPKLTSGLLFMPLD